MSFRARLLLIFTVVILAAVGIVDLLVLSRTRQAFEHSETQRAEALVLQFRKEFERRQRDLVRTVNAIAASEPTRDMAMTPDYSRFYDVAGPQAATHDLDLLELVAGDGTIISSAQWGARFGYKEEWLAVGPPGPSGGPSGGLSGNSSGGSSGNSSGGPSANDDWNRRGAFLRREELPQRVTLAMVAVGTATEGDRKIYVAGGRELDRDFLSTLVLPGEMRVLLYRNLEPGFSPAQLIDAAGPAANAAPLRPLIEQVLSERRERSQLIGSAAAAESIHALPLPGLDNTVLGVLLIASSRRELVALENSLLQTGVIVAAAGILLGFALSWWAAARVTRPVQRLAESAGRVAAGDWSATVDVPLQVSPSDELGQLARAFNRMTGELVTQRERLVQAERVAAWRELARRLAHELKNPLFPLQITVENMLRARDQYPDQFDEVFREGTATLLAELSKLKQIVGRFSDFARMPAPEIQPVEFNALVLDTLKLFAAQLEQAGIQPVTGLDAAVRQVSLDAEQLTRAMRNLVLNAIDAMPEGGKLTVRTKALGEGGVRLEVSDTGQGLTPEECARLFTPYYTTKTHGTGLGLAIVQSVVSDHGGRISVESEKGKGSTFRIELTGTNGTPTDR